MVKADWILTDSEIGLKIVLQHNGEATINIPPGAREVPEIAFALECFVAFLKSKQIRLQSTIFPDEESKDKL